MLVMMIFVQTSKLSKELLQTGVRGLPWTTNLAHICLFVTFKGVTAEVKNEQPVIFFYV